MFAVPRRTIHLYPGELADLTRAAWASAPQQRALIASFEDAFARHVGTRHAIPVGSGRLGLKLTLEGLSIGTGARVIVPAFTDQSVPEAVRRAGAEPLFVDVDKRTFNIDPERLEQAITPDTRAIIATHIFGAPCDISAIEAIAERHDLVILEDCAHAIDASAGDRKCGTLGRAAIFSFVVTKAINTFGGGMVVTDDDALADYVRNAVAALPLPETAGLIRRVVSGYALHGATRPDVFAWLLRPALSGLEAAGGDVVDAYNKLVRPSTINGNVDRAFSPIQAAAGLQQLRDLADTQAARSDAARRLHAALPSWLQPQLLREGDTHAWYFFVASTADPDEGARRLARKGVDTGRHPMRNVAALDDPARGPVEFPAAQHVMDHGLQLPIHPTLGARAVDGMIDAVRGLEP